MTNYVWKLFCFSIDWKLKNRSRGTLTFTTFIFLKLSKEDKIYNSCNKYEMLMGALRPAPSARLAISLSQLC